MLIHDEVVSLLENGLVTNPESAPSLELVNTASMDITLGSTILVEDYCIFSDPQEISYRDRESPQFNKIVLGEDGFLLSPGMFVLGHSEQNFKFPDDIGALYRAKSSMGRMGFEHADAGWVDPGFYGSLTLEFVNITRGHSIRLRTGDRVGQLIFFRGSSDVGEEFSYRTIGNYCGFSSAKTSGYKK